MDRRSFGVRVALAAGWLGLWPDAVWAQAVADPWQRQARRLSGILGHRASAERIGRAYLQAHPAEARIEPLVAGLTGGWGEEGAWLEGAGSRELRARLREQIRADFGARRTVSVRGWVLAQSEARLFALAALSAA
jgi:hypothetical protein